MYKIFSNITWLISTDIFSVCIGAMELIAPGDRVRTVGGKINGSENGFSLFGPIGFPKKFSLLITLRVQPKVRANFFYIFYNNMIGLLYTLYIIAY